VKLESIKIENFFPLGEEFLTFNHVKYAVFGINHDDQGSSSNGAGKSALLHAIIWCLFGTTPREGLLSDGVIGPNGDHVRVVLTFTHAGRRIEIDRGRKVPGRRNSEPIVKIDGEDVSLHKGNDKLIEQTLGFSRQAFMLAGYAASKRASFCELTPAKKLEVLTEVLDLTPYDRMIDDLKAEGMRRKTECESLVSLANTLEQGIAQQDQRIAALENQLSQFEAQKAAKLAQSTALIESLRQAFRPAPDPVAYPQQLAEIEASLEALRRSQREYSQQAPKKALLEKRLEKNLDEQKGIEQLLSDLQDKIDNVLLVGGGECAYCGSHRTEVNTKLLHAFSSEREQVCIRQALVKAGADDLRQQILDFVMPEAPDEKEIDRLNGLRSSLALKLQAYEREVHACQMAQTQLSNAEKMLELHRAESSDSLQAQLEKERLIVDGQLKKFDGMARKISQLEDEMSALKTTLKILRKTKQEILFGFISSLEQQIQRYFEKMDTDLTVKAVLDGDKLDLLFHNTSKQGVYYPYGVFSGGEAARIDKAVTLALNGVFQIGLYIDDEALASLDSTGSRALVDFLFEDATDTRLLVFHNKSLEDYFDRKSDTRQILVEKRGGKATLRMS
jgi:DNA repair exonuclease SbcCD ATPase subunit